MNRILMTALGLVALTAAAQAQVKIGVITTLSGPAGYLGEDSRDAILLAVEQEGGKLGGVPVQVLVEDDGLKPPNGKQIAEKFLKVDKVKIFTGTIFSNVAGAFVSDVLDDGGFFMSNNTGVATSKSNECHPNLFTGGWDVTVAASAGQNANNLGFKKLYIMSLNYFAGTESAAAVKKLFKGEIVGESYGRLDQTDFAAEIAQIRAAKPDALYSFVPGGQGITFLKQYAQAGMLGEVPMVVGAPSLDSRILQAVGDAALGIHVSAPWNADLDNPASKQFVAAFQQKYNRLPTIYAAMAYDVTRLIGSGLKAVNGNVGDGKAFRAALLKADFDSVRGKVNFSKDQAAMTDWYDITPVKGADGKLSLKSNGLVFKNTGGLYADLCKMPAN